MLVLPPLGSLIPLHPSPALVPTLQPHQCFPSTHQSQVETICKPPASKKTLECPLLPCCSPTALENVLHPGGPLIWDSASSDLQPSPAPVPGAGKVPLGPGTLWVPVSAAVLPSPSPSLPQAGVPAGKVTRTRAGQLHWSVNGGSVFAFITNPLKTGWLSPGQDQAQRTADPQPPAACAERHHSLPYPGGVLSGQQPQVKGLPDISPPLPHPPVPMAEEKTFRYGFIMLGFFLVMTGMFIMSVEKPHIYISFCALGVLLIAVGIVWSMCQCYPKVGTVLPPGTSGGLKAQLGLGGAVNL